MTGETTAGAQMRPEASSFSSYEQVSKELEREAVGVDFRTAAEAIGGLYDAVDGKEVIMLTMISTPYELRKEGLFRNHSPCGDVWAKIIVCDYVRRQGRMPLTGEWLPLGLFPHAPSLVRAFQSSAEKKIALCFRRDLEGLKQRCAALGATGTEGRVAADYVCRFSLLPHVPLYLSFWLADEEFDADCKLLFDGSAADHIAVEYLAYLLERFAEELAAD